MWASAFFLGCCILTRIGVFVIEVFDEVVLAFRRRFGLVSVRSCSGLASARGVGLWAGVGVRDWEDVLRKALSGSGLLRVGREVGCWLRLERELCQCLNWRGMED